MIPWLLELRRRERRARWLLMFYAPRSGKESAKASMGDK